MHRPSAAIFLCAILCVCQCFADDDQQLDARPTRRVALSRYGKRSSNEQRLSEDFWNAPATFHRMAKAVPLSRYGKKRAVPLSRYGKRKVHDQDQLSCVYTGKEDLYRCQVHFS